MSAYSDDFKREAVRAVRLGETVPKVAKRLKCSPSSLRGWVAKFSDEDLGLVVVTCATCGAERWNDDGPCGSCGAEPADPDDEKARDGDDLAAAGARVVAVFGAFASRVMVEMPTRLAEELFNEPLADCSRTEIFDGVERDLAEITKRDADLGRSALAGLCRGLALELENPYNSATSKAQCAGQLRDTLAQLRELAPPERKASGLDDLKSDRSARLAGGAGTAD